MCNFTSTLQFSKIDERSFWMLEMSCVNILSQQLLFPTPNHRQNANMLYLQKIPLRLPNIVVFTYERNPHECWQV